MINMIKILLDELSNIISAYKEGKTLQFYTSYGGFKDVSAEEFDIEKWYKEPKKFRIKPEVKYRPFANAEECWKEMLKHQPFGWIKCVEGYLNITYVGDEQVYLADPDGGAILLDSKNSYQDNTFVDGTPFGIKLEE